MVGRLGGIDLHYRHVRLRIGSDYLPRKISAVRQGDFQTVGLFDDVIVRQNVARRADDHARAQTLLALIPGPGRLDRRKTGERTGQTQMDCSAVALTP